MAEDIEYIPITTKNAVEAVLNRAWLYRAEIPDFRALIEGVQDKGKERGLDPSELEIRCVTCRIVECACSGLKVTVPLILGKDWLDQDSETVVKDPLTVFERSADFSEATFTEHADFHSVTFTQDAAFSYATFTQDAYFHHAMFTQDAYFIDTTFTQRADFYGATFTQDAYFAGATFMHHADFQGARLEQTGRFRRTEISAPLSLRGAKLGAQARLDFAGIELRPGGHIELTIDQIGRRGWRKLIRGEDSREKGDLESAAAQYNTLRDNFRTLPSTDDEEDRCHYKYMDLRRRASDWHWPHRLADWLLLKWSWGYGIYTKRIILSIFLVVLGFGLVYSLAAGPDTIRDYYAASERSASTETESAHPEPETEFHPLYFSVITFTTIGYGDYAPRGWLRVVAGAEGFLGLFLMAVFTVSFARKFIR